MYSDEESGGLLCALLFGEREYLASETRYDFTRAGMSHVLALSGMHLALLSFAIDMILSRLGIMKKPRKIAQILFVLIYMILTGFPASVMRAGIMLIISSLLFLLSHRSDSITTLFVAVTVILIVEPYAAYDIGLWLSALATLGILLFAEFYESEQNKAPKSSIKKRLFRIFLLPILISLFAFGSTLILSASTFKSFSLVAPVTTPIYSVAVEIYMYIGILFLAFCHLLSLGNIVKPFGAMLVNVVRYISSIKGVYTAAEYPIIKVMLITLTVAFLAFAVLNIKRRRSAVTLIACMIITVFTTAFCCSAYSKNSDHFDYVLDDNKEWIVMQECGNITILDITTSSKKTVSMQVEYMHELGVTEIDFYIFTSYSSYTPEAVDKLLGSVYVNMLYLPVPQNEDELAIAECVITDHTKSKTEFCFYKQEEYITCGEFNIFPAYRSPTTNKLALTILHNDDFYTYLSSGMLENDTKNVALPLIDGCNTLILGRHGNSYSNYKFVYQVDGLNRLVVSSKNLTIPSETVRFYNEQDTDLYYSPEQLELYVE